MQFCDLPADELLAIHAAIGRELQRRGIQNSNNNPVGDLAEHLFCQAFAWKRAPASEKAFDATLDGVRYQIKGRRISRGAAGERQLGVMRDLEKHGFDVLAAVLFGPDYNVARAALIPYDHVCRNATFSTHQRGYIFHLRDGVWGSSEVRDVTSFLRSVRL